MKIFFALFFCLPNILFPQTSVKIDLNNDGTPEIGKIMRSPANCEERPDKKFTKKAYVFSGEEQIFESDPCWDVYEILAGDLNNDGQNEIALLLWKKANYGKSMPFWESENDTSIRMHLFLYKMDNNPATQKSRLKPIWQSSNLPTENLRTRAIKISPKSKTEIFVIEKSATPPHKYSLAIWRWGIWGFELVARKELF